MKEKEVLIIIPAYNEAANIGKVLDQLEKPEISDIADILVMNDASVDATNWLVKVRGHALVTHVFNLGYGNVKTLFKRLNMVGITKDEILKKLEN